MTVKDYDLDFLQEILLPAPWDDPSEGAWHNTIVELPEEYREVIDQLQLKGLL